jgi:hypothetical protein
VADQKKSGFNYRDSDSGQYTTKKEADKSPKTHEKERRK